MVSAHWETSEPSLTAAQHNTVLHDFHGFPPELYRLTYPAPGAPDVASAAADLLRAAGFPVRVDAARGLDHGAWVPMRLGYPQATTPVLQLSIQPHRDAEYHLAVGAALAELRHSGVLIVASGSFTHNLGAIDWRGQDPAPHWVTAFADWIVHSLKQARLEDLIVWRSMAPFAVDNHPTTEHFLPLFVALGAIGPAFRAEHLHQSLELGVLRMDAFAFHAPATAAG